MRFLFLAVGVVMSLSARAQDIVTLPDTKPLTLTGDLSAQMHEAALRDMDKKIAASLEERPRFWHRDTSTAVGYADTVEPNRQRFWRMIGLADAREPVRLERFGDDENPALVAETKSYRVFQVRWPVLKGVTGEGLLLEPKNPPRGFIIAIPDADQSPEAFAGLAPGVEPVAQMPRRFVENGFTVVVPVVLSRDNFGVGDPAIVDGVLPLREWIHRQAWTMGRTLIGYEVHKVGALVDWITLRQNPAHPLPVGVAGYGEGGLIAFYTAAAYARVDAALVKGYFKSRQQTWSEPLYRDVWGLLREFGDAEIASLIAPRGLIIQYADEPAYDDSHPARHNVKSAPGKLLTPSYEEVEAEFQRLRSFVPDRLQSRALTRDDREAAAAFAGCLGVPSAMSLSDDLPHDQRRSVNINGRQYGQGRELENHVQHLVRVSDHVRNDFCLHRLLPEAGREPWTYAQFPAKDAEATKAFERGAAGYKQIFWEEVLGKLNDPLPPLNPRTRKIYDTPKFTGYDVVLDVGGEGFAWGVILLPKDLKPGEKRPVVVCQHGRHGLPKDVIEGDIPAYHNFAARLAEQGFITLAPHNLYQKEAYYRTLARKGHAVKASLFSVILRHHQQWLKWLATLPNVDPQRIAFYGLSFGGESAVRIPPLLDGYCLSICSGDFNDWTRKLASTDDRHSFMFTDEWEIACFNMGNTFNYAELTYLMFPRPFMVERGHHDGVSIDSWVASEYAKTRWLYDQFGMGDRTRIEFFNGGHTINGQGTFDFLHQHLNWPRP